MTAASSLLLACCLLLLFQGQRGRGGAVVKRTPGVSRVGRWHRPQPQHPRVGRRDPCIGRVTRSPPSSTPSSREHEMVDTREPPWYSDNRESPAHDRSDAARGDGGACRAGVRQSTRPRLAGGYLRRRRLGRRRRFHRIRHRHRRAARVPQRPCYSGPHRRPAPAPGGAPRLPGALVQSRPRSSVLVSLPT